MYQKWKEFYLQPNKKVEIFLLKDLHSRKLSTYFETSIQTKGTQAMNTMKKQGNWAKSFDRKGNQVKVFIPSK